MLEPAARVALAIALLLCGVEFIGWVSGTGAFVGLGMGWARMSLPTIFCALLCAVAIARIGVAGGMWRRALGTVPPVVVATIAGYALLRYALSGDFDGAIFGPGWGQVAPTTALNFLLLAIALLLPESARGGRAYAALIAVALVVTALGLVGYAFGVEALYHVRPFSAMSLPTVIAFALLLPAALAVRPGVGWTAILLSGESGGKAARLLLPVEIILSVLFAGIMVAANRHGAFEASFGFALLAVLLATTMSVATLVAAAWLSRSERERLRGERLIRAISENMPAALFAKDTEGRYLLVNRRYCELFGADADAIVGKVDAELFPDESAAIFRAMDRQVLATGDSISKEITLPYGGFASRSYLSMKAPLRDETGQTIGVLGISTDITERKQAEAALAASEARARLIIDTALDAVVSIDRRGAITGWNPQAERTFGWARDEVLGRPIDGVMIPEPQREAHRRGLARYLATGDSNVMGRRLQMTALDREGREFPIELSITPIRAGEQVSFSGFVRDITERRTAERRLQAQLERLRLLDQITRAIGQRHDMESVFQVTVRAVEDQLPADFVCIWLHDRVAGTLRLAHMGVRGRALGAELGIAGAATLEIGAEELAHYVTGALLHEPDIAALDLPLVQRMAREGLRALVIAPLPVEGEVFGVLMVARADEGFLSSDCEFLKQLGEHVGLAAHQAQLRESLQHAYDDLRQTQQAVLQQERLSAIGQMASGIAHDINNAISPVSVYTQSLIERDLELAPEVRGYLDIVDRVTKDISATVARMRDFYRPRDPDADQAPVDLNELVPQVVELTRARWSDLPQRRGVAIAMEMALAPGLPQVKGSASEIREALTNLVFNAVDAMAEGGTITIRTTALPGGGDGRPRVRLEVGDTGAGMDEATRERCLDPFFTTKGERGTGLGLAMVHGAAQRHGAQLDIDSAPGEGTRVALEFAALAERDLRAEPVRADRNARALRLLLVDDDPAVLRSTAFVLNLDGHRITTADGGAAGVETLGAAHAAGEPFDAVITDLGMPYIDGNQVARTAKELFPDTAVLLLTGWGRRMARGDETPAHVDFVLPKPVDLDELRGVLVQIE